MTGRFTVNPQGMPATLTLMSQKIDVLMMPRILDHVEGEDGESHHHDLNGYYEPSEQRILVSETCGFDLQRETLLHECLHSFLNFTHMQEVLVHHDPQLDEHLVSVLAPVVLSWMRDNPEAMAYLMETQP